MKTFKIIFFLIILIAYQYKAYSQKVLLNENTHSLYDQKSDFGPGQKKFSHLYFGYGLMFDNPNFQNIRLEAWRSTSITTGWRTQRKLLNFYTLGTDLYYNFNDFAIKQYDGKTFPDIALHQKELLSFHNIGAEIYQRITFFQIGKLMGIFLDFGAYANYSFVTKYIEKDRYTDYTNNAKIRVITYRGLNYIEDYHYGVHVRLGINKWVIASGYRLSPLLKNTDVYLPPIWFELQLGLHK